MRLDLLRHGETELSHTLRGSTDDALTALGWQQMQDAVDQAKQPTWDVIISSPLQRCHTFAQQLQQKLRCPLWIESDLQEMHFGDWETKTTQWIYEQHPDELAQFWQTPTQYTPPHAESFINFQQRVKCGLHNIQQQMHAQQKQHALVVTHGGVIKLCKLMALQQPLDDVLKMSAELGKLSSFQLNKEQQLTLQDEQP